MFTRKEEKSENFTGDVNISSLFNRIGWPSKTSSMPTNRSSRFFWIKRGMEESLYEMRYPEDSNEENRAKVKYKKLEKELKELLFKYNVRDLPDDIIGEIGKFIYGQEKTEHLVNRK